MLQITCDNCGAKYRLPETFTGTQATIYGFKEPPGGIGS